MIVFRKLFYSPIINIVYRNFFKLFKTVLPIKMKVPVVGVIQLKDDKKIIKFYSNETSPMTRILYWEENGFSFEFSRIFIALIKNSSSYIDIGGNVGYYSLLASTYNQAMRIYTFEPSNGPYYFLQQNIELNNCKNIMAEKIALSDKAGSIDFFEERNPKFPYIKYHASGIGNTKNTWEITNFEKYAVATITLDEYVKTKGIASIDLIKMDTEGTEDLILSQAKNVLRDMRPIIVCEVLTEKIAVSIEGILTNYNYTFFKFIEDTKKIIPIIKMSNEMETENRNFFFVPNEKKEALNAFL
jgi:FkbM family methyltransferase